MILVSTILADNKYDSTIIDVSYAKAKEIVKQGKEGVKLKSIDGIELLLVNSYTRFSNVSSVTILDESINSLTYSLRLYNKETIMMHILNLNIK